MWDVWFHGQIVCSNIEHLSNIDEIVKKKIAPSEMIPSHFAGEMIKVWCAIYCVVQN